MIDEYLAHLRAGGQAAGTVHNRERYLLRFTHFLGRAIEDASASDCETFLAHPCWKRETLRSARSALKGYFDWLQATGRRADNPTALLARVKPTPPLPRPTPEPALHAALSAADERTHLMVRLAAEAGLRRAEIAQVNMRDLEPDLLGVSLLVHGKGGKERIVPLNESLERELRRACTSGGGWAFPGGVGGHLGAARVGELMTGLLPAGITPHSLRHRFATTCYRASGDLLAVQLLLGHSSPETTRRYVMVDASRLRGVALAAA